jgi:Flp pilus assembly pilin Flp
VELNGLAAVVGEWARAVLYCLTVRGAINRAACVVVDQSKAEGFVAGESPMKLVNKSLRRRRGQGMTEYIIIVGLIAILLVAAVTKFKDALGKAYEKGAGAIESEITTKIPGNG